MHNLKLILRKSQANPKEKMGLTATRQLKATNNKEGGEIATDSVQFSRSVVSNSATPWTAARQASLSITNSRSLLKLMSIEWVMPSNPLILCHPLLLLPSIFPSIRVFSNQDHRSEETKKQSPKHWTACLFCDLTKFSWRAVPDGCGLPICVRPSYGPWVLHSRIY